MAKRTRKRKGFIGDCLEVTRRNSKGQKEFHAKGKPEKVISKYLAKFDAPIKLDCRTKEFKRLTKKQK